MIPENTATPPTADRQAFKVSRTSEVWDLCAPDAALMVMCPLPNRFGVRDAALGTGGLGAQLFASGAEYSDATAMLFVLLRQSDVGQRQDQTQHFGK
jgi:hypothetical protein